MDKIPIRQWLVLVGRHAFYVPALDPFVALSGASSNPRQVFLHYLNLKQMCHSCLSAGRVGFTASRYNREIAGKGESTELFILSHTQDFLLPLMTFLLPPNHCVCLAKFGERSGAESKTRLVVQGVMKCLPSLVLLLLFKAATRFRTRSA